MLIHLSKSYGNKIKGDKWYDIILTIIRVLASSDSYSGIVKSMKILLEKGIFLDYTEILTPEHLNELYYNIDTPTQVKYSYNLFNHWRKYLNINLIHDIIRDNVNSNEEHVRELVRLILIDRLDELREKGLFEDLKANLVKYEFIKVK